MNVQLGSQIAAAERCLPFECVALVLQGGGALGAYQGGVYEALAEANIHPDWIAGISIGAINGAIIAGNAPNDRVDRLREFWTQVTSIAPWHWPSDPFQDLARSDDARNLLNQMSAGLAMACGATGFFFARPLMPWLQPGGTLAATSFYDTNGLKQTLERLVDFDRLNAGITRFSAGAVNVRTGNFVYFDTNTHTIRPEHVMASGALPPSFPAVEIEGEHYWDGGLVSNTPLEWVIDYGHEQDTLAFQVDLWSARGQVPRNIAEVVTRQKEIQYSSRTRAGTDHFKRVQRIRRAIDALLRELPEEFAHNEEVQILRDRRVAQSLQHHPTHLSREELRRPFQRLRVFPPLNARSLARGLSRCVRTLRHPEVLTRPTSLDGVLTFDLERDGRE